MARGFYGNKNQNKIKRISKFDSIYYIHSHEKNIGNLLKTKEKIDWIALKKQSANLLLTDFSNKWKGSVTKNTYMSDDASGALDNAIYNLKDAVEYHPDEVFNALDKEMTKKLQEIVDNDLLSKIHVENKKITKQLLKNIVDNQGVKDLNTLFNILNKMLNLVDGAQNLGLAMILNNFITPSELNRGGRIKDLSILGKRLSRRLATWRTTNEGKTFTDKEMTQMNYIENYLRNLSYALTEGKFKSTKKPLSTQGLGTLLSNNFTSIAIAETSSIICDTVARSAVKNIVPKAVGASQGVVIENEDDSKSITNKTDILLENIQIGIDVSAVGSDNYTLNMNIGISNKFSKSQSFIGANGSLAGIYKSGSGGTLHSAIKALGLDDRKEYLIYNYFAHNKNQQELNNVILTRQFLKLFASANTKDFAQYMLINGRIVSIWQLMQYVIINQLGYSRSDTSADNNQAISLSIPDRPSIYAKLENDEASDPENVAVASRYDGKVLALGWHRSKIKNDTINDARIYAELRLNKLKNFIT